jgi:3-phenylpropionate/trans-cinnamate dioxygenase ferredoxin reductase component
MRRVVVVGGGYIGLEAAAVLTKLGCQVTLLEALPRLLARVAGEDLSAFIATEHRSHGVDVRLETALDCMLGDGRVSGVRLASGEELPCDIVVVGIGIVPAVGPLIAAGRRGQRRRRGRILPHQPARCLCHRRLRGPCQSLCRRRGDPAGKRAERARHGIGVAKAICGDPEPYDALPWFWSNQYDLRLQTAGSTSGTTPTVLRGDPASRSFSVVYLKGGRMIALDASTA